MRLQYICVIYSLGEVLQYSLYAMTYNKKVSQDELCLSK